MVVVTGCVLVGGSILSSHRSANADAITDKIGAAQQALAADAAANAQLKAEISDTRAQEAVLRSAISALDARIAQTNDQVTAGQAQLDLIRTNLARARENLAWTQAQLAGDRTHLADELVVMYKAENASSSFSNLLSSGDFNSFWQHVLDVHRLASSENQLVAKVTLEEAAVAAEVAGISQQERDQAVLVSTLQGLVRQLNDTLATRQEAEQNLAAREAADGALLAQNEQSQREVAAQIAQLQAEEAAALAAGGGSGQFAWPERGPITQGFGCTTFPFEPYDANCPGRHFHSGIDIAASCGNDIDAADSGIAHTYYSSYGYGDHIIIVHGNGWVSVYGHMSSFTVSDGQEVHRGQFIGYEGSTGNSTGCHLHFEIDLNGTPENPIAYLS